MAWTLLNTRPAHQARPTTEVARALGYDVIECPTQSIACMPARKPNAEVWVFTSANAVRCYLEQQKRLPQGRLIAIGPQTAATLQNATEGGPPLFFELPKNFNSENVLKMSIFDPKNALAGQKVAIVKGKGGRTLLKNTLQAQGWAVEEMEVYRRVGRALCEGWAQFRQAEKPLVLAMSVEAIDALLARVPAADKPWLLAQPVLCLSERIATALAQKGWQGERHIAPTSDRAGMIKALETLREHP